MIDEGLFQMSLIMSDAALSLFYLQDFLRAYSASPTAPFSFRGTMSYLLEQNFNHAIANLLSSPKSIRSFIRTTFILHLFKTFSKFVILRF